MIIQTILADADIDTALDGVIFDVDFNAGECNNSGNRALVERSIAADFQAAVVERSRHVPVGDPLDPTTKVGAAKDAGIRCIDVRTALTAGLDPAYGTGGGTR